MNHNKIHTLYIFIVIVLTVQFSMSKYISSERSRGIPVMLILGGDISSNKITVTVIPSDQSPVSAEGKEHLPYSGKVWWGESLAN